MVAAKPIGRKAGANKPNPQQTPAQRRGAAENSRGKPGRSLLSILRISPRPRVKVVAAPPTVVAVSYQWVIT